MSPKIEAGSLGDALNAFRLKNNLPPDETRRTSWSCRLGPLTLVLPNFAWRRRAVLAHDLHHLITGYPCSLRGEFLMATWELGAGPMPHWGATLFCQPLMLAAFVVWPKQAWSAFRCGRRSRSLHRSVIGANLLTMPLAEASAQLLGFSRRPGRKSDISRLIVLLAQAALILFFLLTPVALLAVLPMLSSAP